MIESKSFLDVCKEHGFTFFTGTPCSYLKPFINYVIDDKELDFVGTANEGDAVALASGAWLGKKNAIVMFQNSGLGNAVNPITSLSYTSQIPFIGITTLRGEPGGVKDEPQHKLMGEITTKLLEIMQVPWAYFPEEESEVVSAFQKALDSMEKTRLPYFFVMRKGSVNAYELQSGGDKRVISNYENNPVVRKLSGKINVSRTQALEKIQEELGDKTAIIATTGKTGRELFEIGDRPNQMYMVGSMGCASAIGLGLTLSEHKGHTCVIDGDGALLMRLENMATTGQIAPKKLIHILLDNGTHDSTGGQQTGSETIDFAGVAKSCGYKKIYELDQLNDLDEAITSFQKNPQLTFIRFITLAGSPKTLGRPTVTPAEVSLRMRNFLGNL